MQTKITVFKSGLLSEKQLEELGLLVDELGLVEGQEEEAVQDLEMVIYLRWIQGMAEGLNEGQRNDLKLYLSKHQAEENSVLGYLVSVLGQTVMGARLETVVDEEIEKWRKEIKM